MKIVQCKYVSVMMAVVLIGGMVGCGSEKVPTTANPTPTTPATPSIPSTPATPTPPTAPSLLVSGKVMAGSQPISGANIQIYAAGVSGNSAGATALLATPATTDSSGAFTVTSGLNCSSSQPMIYLVARGGRVVTDSDNAAIGLSAVIGNCNALSTSATTAFTINEVTTVAFSWSLAQFLAADGSVGASSTNALGLANAFATAVNLADVSQGKSPGPNFPANGKAPVEKINSLANVLDRCVIKASSCADLMSVATLGGTSAPASTLEAAIRLARNPGNNVGALFTQAASNTAFMPALTSAPSDWTLSINFTGAAMNAPTGIGVDSQGNVWVASLNGVASKFTPTGTPVFPTGITGSGIQTSWGLAIDASDNVWIPNEDSPRSVNNGFGSITVLNSSGQAISGATGFSAGGLSYPVTLAIDPNGNVWVANFRNSRVTLLSSSGVALSGATGYGASSLAFIVSMAIDANHNAWIGNQSDQTITRLSSDGSQSLAVTCCDGAQGLAIDPRGYVWATNFYSDSVSQVSSTGTVISAGYTAGGLSRPQPIAIDGAGTVWAVSLRSAAGAANPTLVQFAGSASSSRGSVLSPATGWLADVGLIQPYGMAIDASGNLWITNFASDPGFPNSNSITEVIGMAAPIKTPLIGPAKAP